MHARLLFLGTLLGMLPGGLAPPVAVADADEIASEDVTVGEDAQKRYFRIGPRAGAKAPQDGYALLVILPGGDGGADFHPFCKRIVGNALGDDYVAVQPVAVKWTGDQAVVWPTEKNRVEKMRFSTESFVEAVIADAGRWQPIDPKRTFVLAWSSSGPAAYSLSLTRKSSPAGYFIAMSVFKPDLLPKLSRAKGKAYFLYHSAEDKVCPYRMAKEAEAQLTRKGARVRFRDYAGGHGWRGDVYGDIKAGIAWLGK